MMGGICYQHRISNYVPDNKVYVIGPRDGDINYWVISRNVLTIAQCLSAIAMFMEKENDKQNLSTPET